MIVFLTESGYAVGVLCLTCPFIPPTYVGALARVHYMNAGNRKTKHMLHLLVFVCMFHIFNWSSYIVLFTFSLTM